MLVASQGSGLHLQRAPSSHSNCSANIQRRCQPLEPSGTPNKYAQGRGICPWAEVVFFRLSWFKVPQATHLISFFASRTWFPCTDQLWRNELYPFPFSQPPVAASPVLQEKLLGRLLILVGVIQLSLLMAGSHSSQISETSFGDTIHVCKISSSSFGKPQFSSNFPKPSVLQVASSGSSSTMVRISSSIIRRRCTRFFFSSSLWTSSSLSSSIFLTADLLSSFLKSPVRPQFLSQWRPNLLLTVEGEQVSWSSWWWAHLLEGSSGHDLQERGTGTSRFPWRLQKCHDATFFCAPSHQPGREANQAICQVWQLDSARHHFASAPAWRRIWRIWVLMDFTAVSARPLLRGSSSEVRVRWIPLTAPLFEVPLKFHSLGHYVCAPHDTHQLAIARACPWWHVWLTSLAFFETLEQQGEKLWFQTLWLLRSRPPFSPHLLPQSFLFLLPHPLGPFPLLRLLLLRRRRCLGLQVQVLDLQLVSELLLLSLHRSLVLLLQVLQLLLLLGIVQARAPTRM